MPELRLVLRQTRWALLVILRVRETVMFLVVLLIFIFGRAGATTEFPGGGELSASAYFTAACVDSWRRIRHETLCIAGG